MRVVLYIVILALLFLAPVKKLDVAKLEPVQTVAICIEEDAVVVKTDTENSGRGENVDEAINDLEQTTPGVIYLDTAQYLLVGEDAVNYVDALRRYLKPSVKVCLWDEEGNVTDAAKYLAVRSDLPEIRDWKTPDGTTTKKVEKMKKDA